MIILYFLVFVAFITPVSPTTQGVVGLCSPPRKTPTGEVEEDFCKLINLKTKCGQKASVYTEPLKLDPGYTYVNHKITIIRSDPRSNRCEAAWDAKEGLKVNCKCVAHPKCEKNSESGAWSGPDGELRVLIHLWAKKD